jgi:hypothetical protein
MASASSRRPFEISQRGDSGRPCRMNRQMMAGTTLAPRMMRHQPGSNVLTM